MNQPNLGFTFIINNLKSQIPDSDADVQSLKTALETIGFDVQCYDDCSVQVNLRKGNGYNLPSMCCGAIYTRYILDSNP